MDIKSGWVYSNGLNKIERADCECSKCCKFNEMKGSGAQNNVKKSGKMLYIGRREASPSSSPLSVTTIVAATSLVNDVNDFVDQLRQSPGSPEKLDISEDEAEDVEEHVTPHCLPCKKKFTSWSSLEEHVVLNHFYTALYECVNCSATFASSMNVCEHMNKLHRVSQKFILILG